MPTVGRVACYSVASRACRHGAGGTHWQGTVAHPYQHLDLASPLHQQTN